MSNTREKIISKALEMCNTNGIENVGVRELAKELGMKGGNITYYFPTKDDIIIELAQMLGRENSAVIVKKEKLSMLEFLEMFRIVYQNHYTFRSLFLSFANMLKQNETLREQYKKRAVLRKETMVSQIESLIRSGYIKKLSPSEVMALHNSILITSRFWIANASVDEELEPKNKCIQKYLAQLACMISFVATAKGKKELSAFMTKDQKV